MEGYVATVEDWRRAHERSYTADDGWLAQVALVPLADEPLADDIGLFTATGEGARFRAAPGADVCLDGQRVDDVVLRDDRDGAPDTLVAGSRRYQIVRRGDAVALRVRDLGAPARTQFRGLYWYPVDPAWRVEARIVPAARAVTMAFTLGQEELATCPGPLVFSLAGAEWRLTPYARPSGALLVVFRDATTGDTTSELCRYLYTAAPDPDGRVVVDFNCAAAPPCVHVATVTCVLPPRENRLAIRIEAGERVAPARG